MLGAAEKPPMMGCDGGGEGSGPYKPSSSAIDLLKEYFILFHLNKKFYCLI